MNRVAELIGLSYAQQRRLFGAGVGVAIIDTGIFPHPDFISKGSRIIAFEDFLYNHKGMYDDNGHGTHIAGIIGGDGTASDGIYCGIAPLCNLIAIKVLDPRGNGNIADVLLGLKWIIENKDRYNIRIMNISVGTSVQKVVDEDSILVQGVNEVWDSGIVVVSAAGNGGPSPMSIAAPGISRKIITVGASDDQLMIDACGNKIRNYSGRGPTLSCICKPDIVAPGSNIVSCNIPKNVRLDPSFAFSLFTKRERYNNMYTVKSGTSMATPIVSGAVALLLSAYPYMTPREVKIRLKNSAVDLGLPRNQQGWGMLNIERMLQER